VTGALTGNPLYILLNRRVRTLKKLLLSHAGFAAFMRYYIKW
jgi:hypothetical protein